MMNFAHRRARRNRRLLSGVVFFGSALMAAGPALAQSNDADADGRQAEETAPAQDEAQQEVTNEIVVTAQKRSEALEDVPISIAAVSNEQLVNTGIQQVVDLPQAVPALRINYAGTFVLPTIRGVGSIVALPGLTQNISTYVDGYYVPTPSASNFNLVNVESVNVLKGPQGTLFGANATGGAIQINTLDPQHYTSGLFRIGYSSYNHLSAQFYGTTGITDTLAADIAASYEYGDGHVTNVVTGDDHVGQFRNYTVRPKLLWTPTDNLSFTFAYEHTYNDDPGTQLVVPRDGMTTAIKVPGVSLTYDDPNEVALDSPGYARRKVNSYTLTSEFEFDFATLTSYTGYREDGIDQALDYDASPAPVNYSNWSVRDKTFTQELNLTSTNDGRFNWVVGAFYLNYKDGYHYFTFGNPIFTTKNKTESYAAFADGTYEVADNLFLTLGGRYTVDKPQVAFNLIPTGYSDAGDTEFKDFSGRGVIRYQLTPRSNVYASYSQGYRSGGLPGSAFSLNPVKPEHIEAYEIGYKTAGSVLRLNLAAFYYDYRDIQVTSYGAGGSSVTQNAARANIYGLDGDIALQITPEFSVNAAGSYVHAEYDKFPNALAYIFHSDPASPNFGTFTTASVDVSGQRVERTPRFSGSIGANYETELGNGSKIALNANLFHTGSYFFDPAHTLKQDSYELLNLKATWTDPSDRFDLSVFAKNVTDSEYFLSNFNDPYASRARYGDPATVGGSVTYRF